MRIVRGAGIRGTAPGQFVLAVGNFDGVHLGHQRVFDVAVRQAEALGLAAALLTFSGHPLRTLRPELAPRPLMDLDDRLKIAGKWGFETAFILDFDEDLASMSPETFTNRILIEKIGAAGVVAGSGWRFGRGRTGDLDFLRAAFHGRDLSVWEVRPEVLGGSPVSSTRIRDLLAEGDVEAARELLGRPHFVRGTVREGRGRGRRLGFPTVNLDTGHLMIPADGVYAGAYLFPERSGPAAVNIGTSPTFEDSIPGIEAHLLQWDGDLYGNMVTIAFLHRLRDERTFGDAGGLSNQIAEDVGRALELFSSRDLEGIET